MRVKKREILLLICVALIGSTSNVYGEPFNEQSPGMEIFNTLSEDGLTKWEIEERLGYSDRSESKFHSIYDYNIGSVEGELKVRYDDAYMLSADEITDNINEDTQVGRLLWKEKDVNSDKVYDYQIENLDDLNFESSLNEVLNDFQEVPSLIEIWPSNDDKDMGINYRDYPMYGERGTLFLIFENNQIAKGCNWQFEIPEGKTLSDYSVLICNCWLKNLNELLEVAENQKIDDTDDVVAKKIYISSLKALNNYYLKVFKEKNKKEMQIFDSALRNLYLISSGEGKGSFYSKICEWEDAVYEEDSQAEADKFVYDFLKIWRTSDKCKLTWDEIVSQDESEYHAAFCHQPVRFFEEVYDENLQIKNQKYIVMPYNPEEFDVESIL